MASPVPPLPYKSPFIRQDGFLNEPWAKWFRDMFNRIGGTSALSNTELEAMQSDDLEEIEADITALQVLVTALQTLTTTHTSEIAALETGLEDLNQGRQL